MIFVKIGHSQGSRLSFIGWAFVSLMLLLSACNMAVPPTPTLTPAPALAISTPVPTVQPIIATRALRGVVDTATPTATPPITNTRPPEITPTATLTPTLTLTPSPTGFQVQIEAGRSGLRLRAEPDTQSEQLVSIAEFTPLTILGRTSDNRWLRVATPEGHNGWIMIYFLNLDIDLDAINVPIDVVVADPPTPEIYQATNAPVDLNLMQYIVGVTPAIRSIYTHGQQLGNRANVFSKVGDSITVGTYFLYPIGWGTYNLRSFSHLNSSIQTFSVAMARDGNSFANNSLAADNQWTSNSILNPALAHPQVCSAGETPLECEYRVVRPSVALIMVGTNDLAQVPVGTFSANVNRIVEISIERGVIPALSTIPPREGYPVDDYNRVIRSIASHHNVPLWDYGAAMRQLPNEGLAADGVHPSWPPGDFAAAADFTSANLNYGYTLRNLMAVQVLDTIWRVAAMG